MGELLRINDKEWQGTIERVLRPFALSLLVDESDYTKVSRYIDKTNLKGRIVYLKTSKPQSFSSSLSENSMVEKIEKSSDIIKTLEEALKKLEDKITTMRDSRDILIEKRAKIDSDIKNLKAEKSEARELYESKKELLKQYEEDLKSYLKEEKIVKIELHTIKRDEHNIRETIQKQIDSLNGKN